MKEHDKTQKNPNEKEINNLPDEEVKAIVIDMLIEFGKRIERLKRTSTKN